MKFNGSDRAIPQGTILSALFVSSANCAGLHFTHRDVMHLHCIFWLLRPVGSVPMKVEMVDVGGKENTH